MEIAFFDYNLGSFPKLAEHILLLLLLLLLFVIKLVLCHKIIKIS